MTAYFILDLSVFLMLAILANLSRRIGEPLQIPPHYRILYTGAALLLFVIIGDVISEIFVWGDTAKYITIPLRGLIALSALPVLWRYWSWLINEKLTRK